jgi:hypothetical protein
MFLFYYPPEFNDQKLRIRATYRPLIINCRRLRIRIVRFKHDLKPSRDIIKEIRLLFWDPAPWVKND